MLEIGDANEENEEPDELWDHELFYETDETTSDNDDEAIANEKPNASDVVDNNDDDSNNTNNVDASTTRQSLDLMPSDGSGNFKYMSLFL